MSGGSGDLSGVFDGGRYFGGGVAFIFSGGGGGGVVGYGRVCVVVLKVVRPRLGEDLEKAGTEECLLISCCTEAVRFHDLRSTVRSNRWSPVYARCLSE